MNFSEINLFGVYVAPIVPMMLAAWFAILPLRWVATRTGLLNYVWHPALFGFAAYIIVLAGIVLLAGSIRP